MIHLTMTPSVSTIRVYDAPGGYEARRPYLGIITITHLTDRIVYVHGAVGRVSRSIYRQALDILREGGVTTVMFERRGQMKTIELASPLVNE